MSFILEDLPYSIDALEPFIDKETMEIHHDKHHNAYTANLNNAVTGTEFEGKSIEEILANVSRAPVAIRNNGGGFYNHNLFWKVMGPNMSQNPSGELADSVNLSFGSFDNFKEEFSKAAATRFGSGWAWLVVQNDKLIVTSTPNQDNPLMDNAGLKGIPILTLDVWEHAYYLKYQNKRPDYIKAWWNIVNWDEVSKRYSIAKGEKQTIRSH